MDLFERFERGETLAEIQGIPPEIGETLARVAEHEIEAGRLHNARTILEGMVVTNHRDAWAWTVLSSVQRRLGDPVSARFCAEVGVRLAPADAHARLARAESLLAFPEHRAEALADLAALARAGEGVGERARALAAACAP
jgi:hypothetical protein